MENVKNDKKESIFKKVWNSIKTFAKKSINFLGEFGATFFMVAGVVVLAIASPLIILTALLMYPGYIYYRARYPKTEETSITKTV